MGSAAWLAAFSPFFRVSTRRPGQEVWAWQHAQPPGTPALTRVGYLTRATPASVIPWGFPSAGESHGDLPTSAVGEISLW